MAAELQGCVGNVYMDEPNVVMLSGMTCKTVWGFITRETPDSDLAGHRISRFFEKFNIWPDIR